jgi:hypothetical protein
VEKDGFRLAIGRGRSHPCEGASPPSRSPELRAG